MYIQTDGDYAQCVVETLRDHMLKNVLFDLLCGPLVVTHFWPVFLVRKLNGIVVVHIDPGRH